MRWCNEHANTSFMQNAFKRSKREKEGEKKETIPYTHHLDIEMVLTVAHFFGLTSPIPTILNG